MHPLFRFEPKHQPLLERRHFVNRLIYNLLAGAIMMGAFLAAGMIGYHVTCGLGWLDSLLNAAMILSGMGPVSPVTTAAGKLFASFYALTSGIVFISIIGITLAPVVHRIFHRFHLEENADLDKPD